MKFERVKWGDDSDSYDLGNDCPYECLDPDPIPNGISFYVGGHYDGLFVTVVCAPTSLSVEEVSKLVNNPSGKGPLSSVFGPERYYKNDYVLRGQPYPCKCDRHEDRIHRTFTC